MSMVAAGEQEGFRLIFPGLLLSHPTCSSWGSPGEYGAKILLLTCCYQERCPDPGAAAQRGEDSIVRDRFADHDSRNGWLRGYSAAKALSIIAKRNPLHQVTPCYSFS
jgi:hypothetical protein